jgi:Fe-S-cluster containining protein
MWKCKKCGTCCRLAGLIIPSWNRGDGACNKLNPDNTCSIYYIRPEICRIDKDGHKDNEIVAACLFVKQLEEDLYAENV